MAGRRRRRAARVAHAVWRIELQRAAHEFESGLDDRGRRESAGRIVPYLASAASAGRDHAQRQACAMEERHAARSRVAGEGGRRNPIGWVANPAFASARFVSPAYDAAGSSAMPRLAITSE